MLCEIRRQENSILNFIKIWTKACETIKCSEIFCCCFFFHFCVPYLSTKTTWDNFTGTSFIKTKKKPQNPVWFSCEGFHRFSRFICSSIWTFQTCPWLLLAVSGSVRFNYSRAISAQYFAPSTPSSRWDEEVRRHVKICKWSFSFREGLGHFLHLWFTETYNSRNWNITVSNRKKGSLHRTTASTRSYVNFFFCQTEKWAMGHEDEVML